MKGRVEAVGIGKDGRREGDRGGDGREESPRSDAYASIAQNILIPPYLSLSPHRFLTCI